jgi:hypothetical protein
VIRALVALAVLLAATGAEACGPYSRQEWTHWIRAANDCRDTRTKVLIRDSSKPVAFRDATKCEVAWGEWIDPYTGDTINDPDKIDVDHMVPLKAAHEAGGCEWSSARKEAFANDLTYLRALRATSAKANRSKGSRGPDEWLPPDKGARCAYVEAWSAVKTKWNLSTTKAEREAIAKALSGCR